MIVSSVQFHLLKTERSGVGKTFSKSGNIKDRTFINPTQTVQHVSPSLTRSGADMPTGSDYGWSMWIMATPRKAGFGSNREQTMLHWHVAEKYIGRDILYSIQGQGS